MFADFTAAIEELCQEMVQLAGLAESEDSLLGPSEVMSLQNKLDTVVHMLTAEASSTHRKTEHSSRGSSSSSSNSRRRCTDFFLSEGVTQRLCDLGAMNRPQGTMALVMTALADAFSVIGSTPGGGVNGRGGLPLTTTGMPVQSPTNTTARTRRWSSASASSPSSSSSEHQQGALTQTTSSMQQQQQQQPPLLPNPSIHLPVTHLVTQVVKFAFR